ncbi:CBS domain containing-hemolysin-like protein [Sporomusaceae bacterium BoRhaA]|nr:CBS domain containing-hemolysin-like protein [Pelorhabdus rhamnosifermentans]
MLAEFALVKIRKTRLQELIHQGDKRAELAMNIVSTLDTYLGATQLGITLASLALGWLGESTISALLEPIINQYFSGSTLLHSTISITLGFLIITFLHIVIGELVPKSIAIQRTEQMAMFVVWPLYIFHKIGFPVIILFERAANAILSLIGIPKAHEANLALSEEELRLIVSASTRGGVLDKMESELIDNVFDFADRTAREVMVPRQDMVCLFMEDSLEENMKVVRETSHTRYPLCSEDKDHVLGMVHLRDIMELDVEHNGSRDLHSLMREILVVPEGLSVASVLQIMKKKRTHLGVVIDEFGGTAGLVAMEDVLEEIVGNIQDEHDEEEGLEIQRLSDNSYEFDGRVLLEDVAELLHIELEEHQEDTIGGYMFGHLGRRPELNDKIIFGNYEFSILAVAGFRIVRVRASLIDNSAEFRQE